MEKINRSALVMYSTEQMFQLVDDIDKYAQFVPNCKQAKVLSREGNQVSATLEVSKSGIAKSFSTRNTNTPYSTIKMELLNGPFKKLEGEWRFIPLADDACKIELELEFEFANRLASMAFAGIFNQLVQSMVTAFTDRAQQVYG